jgi:hypothetical protein
VIKNAKLRDRRTGKKREHDVLVKIQSGNHELLIALECRDRSRYTDVPQIDYFKTKCDATGIENRVMVATAGFSQSAIAAAQVEGIGCWKLDSVSTPDWNVNGLIASYQNIVEHVNFKFCIDKLDLPFIFTNLNGEPISRDSWMRMTQVEFEELQRNEPNSPSATSRIVTLPLDASSLQANFDDGTVSNIRDLVVEVQYRTDGQMVPADIIRITDAIEGKILVEAAVYRVNAVGFDGHIVVKRTGRETSTLQVLSDKSVAQKMEFRIALEKTDQSSFSEARTSTVDAPENAIARLQRLVATV